MIAVIDYHKGNLKSVERGIVAAEENGELWQPCGMGLLPGVVRKLPKEDVQGASFKIPHVGWNSINFERAPLFEGISQEEYFYFTHSYAAPNGPYTIAQTTHSITFPCAVRYGDVAYGVQFHPEKSSTAGMRLLHNFVKITGA